jgi:hypothetical protein
MACVVRPVIPNCISAVVIAHPFKLFTDMGVDDDGYWKITTIENVDRGDTGGAAWPRIVPYRPAQLATSAGLN